MWLLIIILVVLQLETFTMSENDDSYIVSTVNNGADREFNKYYNFIIDEHGLPFSQYCISLIYYLYTRLTLVNVSIFLLKYVPTAFYLYKFIKDVYLTSRKRIQQKQIETEDIELQIHIVNTKLCIRDADFKERAEQLRRGVERLRRVRENVRHVISSDDTLRKALPGDNWQPGNGLPLSEDAMGEDREFIVDLLKELNYDYLKLPESPLDQHENMECGERDQIDQEAPLDEDEQKDCRVKIVRVTNVYKVAYLKHYIKQKRLRRANKQILLKKKMESIKKLLEDWQKTLNMVINSKLTILNIDAHPLDIASQEAMGDYSKPRESSDSDSDLRNSSTDVCCDEYSLSWAQNPYKPYSYNYEDENIAREYYDPQDLGDGYSASYPCDRTKAVNMTSIIEETNSQVAIEEIKGEDEDDCRDLIAL